jgi:hypothetical protein
MNSAPESVKEAKERIADYFGFTASSFIQLDNGKAFEIPNPGLMDDDQLARYEELQFLLEQCDREPDEVVPERTVTTEDGSVTTIPARTIPGKVKTPYRLNGEPLKPNYSVRLAQVIFGEKGYAEYKDGGGQATQVAMEWARMSQEQRDRAKA